MSLFGSRPSALERMLHRPRQSSWQKFWASPCIFLARALYTWARPGIAPPPLDDPVTVICISDTHNSQPDLPHGDILVHAGDLTQSGTFAELQEQLDWLNRQPHKVKVVVAGNHDLLLDSSQDRFSKDPADIERQRERLDWGQIIYLENEETTVTVANGRRLRIYGSPLSPRHGNWAFQFPRTNDVWTDRLPHGVDILITHCPPRGHLDLLRLGCEHLLQELWRVRPRLHVFGHVHEGAGTEVLPFNGLQEAYEGTVLESGGVRNLLRTVFEGLKRMLIPREGPMCQLVNAAMVGGLRDDERRRPVRVVI